MSENPVRMSSADLEALWQPIEINSLVVQNRVTMSAHRPNYESVDYGGYLAARVAGGTGMVVTGAVSAHPTSTPGTAWTQGFKDGVEKEYENISSAVAAAGGAVVGQIYHSGHQYLGTARLDYYSPTVSASSVSSPAYMAQAKELEVEDIAEITAGFVKTAVAMRAGNMDGVEVHAAHGYLLHQFLSPLTNLRDDEYGGDVERRTRIVVEIGRAIRAACGDDYPMGLKISFDEKVGERGITPPLAAETLALIHNHALFDYVSVSGGGYHALQQMMMPIEAGTSGHSVADAALAKQVVGELPVIVTGTIRSLERAAEVVGGGQADMVGMVRANIADPEMVKKAREGRIDEVRPCVGASQGCWRRLLRGHALTCTVNPDTGRELQRMADPRPVGGSRIVVVGGGPAGLRAAQAAAEDGHHVTLLERDAELGGQLRQAGALPGRDSWLKLAASLIGAVDRLGVEVKLGTQAGPEEIEALQPDAVIIATGSTWDKQGYSILRPDRDAIPMAADSHVLSPVEVVDDPEACGERVLVVDDNETYPPLGIAELLAHAGRKVEVITAHAQAGGKTGLFATVDIPVIYPRLAKAGVTFTPMATIERIEPGKVQLADIWGGWQREVEADTVVLCMSRVTNDDLYWQLKERDVRVLRIGDSVTPREVDDAIYEGAEASRKLAERLNASGVS